MSTRGPTASRKMGKSPKGKGRDELNPILPRLPSLPSLLRLSKSQVGLVQASAAGHERDSATNNMIQHASTSSLAGPSSPPDGDTSLDSDTAHAPEVPVRRPDFVATPSTGRGTPTESRPSSKQMSHTPGVEDGASETVVVCLRVRPTKRTSTPIYVFQPETHQITLGSAHPTLIKRGAMAKGAPTAAKEEYDFAFDALLLSPSPTSDLYFRKIQPVVQASMDGFNATVFAYGQTASGKTHTMMGNDDEPGIIPLAIEELFSFISEQQDSRTFTLRVSFLEIYNEHLRDLLTDTPPRGAATKPLDVTGDDGRVFGLAAKSVATAQAVLDYLNEGERRRRVGATDWNERSSRSHCIFTVTIESTGSDGHGGQVDRSSKLNLIDLAGSESATTDANRAKEGAFINKSLLTLATVISKLTEPKTSSTNHIPYRDSKLTRLLQPALSGKARIAIVCTISPDAEQATETLGTLRFAKRSKMIVTKAERSSQVSQMMLHSVAQDMDALARQIAERESVERERDSAIAQSVAQQASSTAEHERKDIELGLLRDQLTHMRSLLLTAPVVAAQRALETPSRRKNEGMSSLGLGSPRPGLRVFSENMGASPRINTAEREVALEVQIEVANSQLALLRASEASTTTELARLRQSSDKELDSLRQELEATKKASAAQLDQLRQSSEKELGTLREQLKVSKAKTATASTSIDGLRKSTKLELAGLRQELAVSRSETVVALERNAVLARDLDSSAQGAAGTATTLAALREQVIELQTMVDGNLATINALETTVQLKTARIEELETLLASSSRQVSLSDTAREAVQLTLEETRVELELVKLREATALSRVEVYRQSELRREGYSASQTASSQKLLDKIALLKNPAPSSRRSDNSSSVSGSGRKVKSVEMEVLDLTEEEERVELRREVRLTQESLVKAHAEAEKHKHDSENWRKMYLRTVHTPKVVEAPALARPTLAELDNRDTLPPRRAARPASTSDLRTRHESAPTTRSHHHSSSVSYGVPPPLPYSPRNQDEERHIRRKTIDKDLATLKATNSVGRTKEALTSPTKRYFDRLPSSPGLRDLDVVLARSSSASSKARMSQKSTPDFASRY